MAVAVERFTGRVVDNLSDVLPINLSEKCDYCGYTLSARCYQCGAPVCCPKCCDEEMERLRNEGQVK
jgi:hypothetical protein